MHKWVSTTVAIGIEWLKRVQLGARLFEFKHLSDGHHVQSK